MLNSSLSESLTNYEQALRNLCECLASISLKQVIQVFNARDRIQSILNENSSVTIEQQEKLIKLDNYLVEHSHEVIIQYDLSELRRSLSPPDEAWWWYLDEMFLSVAKEIIRYENALKALDGFLEKVTQNNNNHLSYQIILDVLLIRDRLQECLVTQSANSDEINQVKQLDKQFKKQLKRFPKYLSHKQRSKLLKAWETWREIYQPNGQAWWWFVKIPVYFWDRLDGFWNFLALVLFAISLSLFLDISSRFLGSGSGLGLLGAFLLIFQIFLGLISAGIFTDFGKSMINKVLKQWGFPEYHRQEMKAMIAVVILSIFIIIYQSLPAIARRYNQWGYYDYNVTRKLDSAEAKFKRAISLDPDNAQAHYNLGVLYEDLQEFEKAKTEYNIAVRGGSSVASNNLARLYILSDDPKNYPIAASLLQKGISLLDQPTINRNNKINYSLYKNLGWVRLKQGYYEDAKNALIKALEIEKQMDLDPSEREADAYCLLAQVTEQLQGLKAAKNLLEKCSNSYQDLNTPEEDQWIHQAQQKLKQLKEKP